MRELILVTDPPTSPIGAAAAPDSGAGSGVLAAPKATFSSRLLSIIFSGGGRLEPLFELGPDESGTPEGDDLACYYRVEAADRDLERLARALGRMPGIAGAYVKEAPEPPDRNPARGGPGGPSGPGERGGPGSTGLDPTELSAAHGRPGARGEGVVLAVMGSEQPEQTLAAPAATVSWLRAAPLGTAGALQRAARKLEPGDLIAVDLVRAAHCGREVRGGSRAPRLPLAWWPDDLAAVRYARRRGVLVLAAAGDLGNLHGCLASEARPSGLGSEDPLLGFPADWRDPFEPGGDRASPLAIPGTAPVSVLGTAAIAAGLQGMLRGMGRAPLELAAARHLLKCWSVAAPGTPPPLPVSQAESGRAGSPELRLPELQRIAARIESFNNVPVSRLATFTEEPEIDGLVPVSITLDSDSGELSAGTVWAPPTGAFPAETRYAFGLSLAEVRARADEWTREGFRPAAYACTEHSDDLYCSMLWVPLDRARWSGYADVLGVEVELFEERRAQYAARGFQLQSVERFPTADGCRVAAVWLVPLRLSSFPEPLPGDVHRVVPEAAS